MTKAPASIYDCACTDLYGQNFPLSPYQGRPLVIVNTASLCSFSRQFGGLEAIWQAHKDKGLILLGVPSNDFGRQEPGDSKEIVSACTLKFGVTFPLLAKTPVKGATAHPLFQWIAKEGGFFARPRWNFYKYVVSPDGQLQNWFSSFTAPEDARFKTAIEKIL